MKQYAFVDWDLIRSTPLKHTYRCGWRELMLGGKSYRVPKRPMRRHITIEWDGKDELTVRTGKLWSYKSRWANNEVKSIVFGIREMDVRERSAEGTPAWLWFIRLTSQSNHVLAEFLVAHQNDAPSTSRARVPARVQELLTWLTHCTGHRVHGPILVADKAARQRILAQVD